MKFTETLPISPKFQGLNLDAQYPGVARLVVESDSNSGSSAAIKNK
jgi:hypothetical protein